MNARTTKGITFLFLCIFIFGITSTVQGNVFDDLEIIPGVRFYGLDLGINYKGISLIPSLTTRLSLYVGGGFESKGYFRDSDEIQYDPDNPAETTNRALFQRKEFLTAAGIRQGIVFNPEKDDNLLEAYFFCRARYNTYNNDTGSQCLLFTTGYPDAYDIFLTTITLGLYFDTRIIHETQRKRKGFIADISLEYAPEFMNNAIGAAAYSRVTVDLRGYFTLIDMNPRGRDKKNIFNLYICDRILSDGLVGDYIPVIARQTVGGRKYKPEEGLGGIMRGIESGRFDGYLKIVNNFDIRCNLPTLWRTVPGAVLYFDTGISDDLNYLLTLENIHYSTGFGLFVRGFGIDFINYINYWIDEQKFSYSFDFSLHF